MINRCDVIIATVIDVVFTTDCDAICLASLLHYDYITISQLKDYARENKIDVR